MSNIRPGKETRGFVLAGCTYKLDWKIEDLPTSIIFLTVTLLMVNSTILSLSSIRLGYGNTDEPYSCANMNPVLSEGKSETHLYALFYKQPSHGKVSGEIKFVSVR